MPKSGNRMGSRLMVSDGEVFLNYVETVAQSLNDFGRRSDHEFVQDAEGFGIDRR